MHLKKTTLALAVILSSTAYSSVVLAQNTDSGLEEVTVTGRYLSIDKLNSVKTPTPILDVPQSLSIFSAEQIEEQAFRNLGDVFRYTPGLSTSQGEGHRDAVIIRGIQTTADFFIDGVRDDVQYYRPLYNVEQVEVLRGSNALLFGRGGGGGIINRVTKQAKVGERFNSVSAGLDSFGAYSVEGDTNVQLSENAALRVNGYYQGLDNHRDFYDGDSFAINPTVTINFSPTTKGIFSYEYVDDDRTVDRGVPSVNVNDGPDVPLEGFEDTFFGSGDENFTTLEANIFRARIEHEFSAGLRGNITAQYADYDKLYQNLFASEEVELVNGSISEVELDGYRDATERENILLQANLVGEFETGSVGHTFLFGFEYGDQETENSRLDNVFAENGDDQLFIPFTDPLSIPSFSFSSLARDRASDVQFTSVYAQDQVDLTDQFKIVIGLRYDEFDIDVNDIRNSGQFNRVDSEVTPRFGAIYKPAENISLYASYSETFLPRSGEQFLTLNLDDESTRPQFFENQEIGLKWDLTQRLSLTTSIFELERESFTSEDPENVGQVIVIDGSTTTGFEVQLVGDVTDTWSLSTGYSYLDSEVEVVDGSGNDGNQTRQTPENIFSIWNNFTVNDKLNLAIGANYQDSFFVREDNSVEVPSYVRFDAAAYYVLNEGMRLQLNIENLFDTEYFPDAHSNDNISTGKPINARLTFSADF